MARRPKQATLSEDGMVEYSRDEEGIVGDVNLDDVIESNMYVYGTMTIEDRAIPDFRDGMLKVYRRLMWSMWKLGLHNSGGLRKSATTVGECFAAGTMVSTPQGVKAIENFEIGDLVNTSIGPRPVTRVFANPPAPLYDLLLKDGKRVVLTHRQDVKVMIDGQFYWKPACDLTPDDQIVVEP